MSYMNEYIGKIQKGWGTIDFEIELRRLISEYNKLRNTYLFVYCVSMDKPIPGIALGQDDFYIIRDLLYEKKGMSKLDMYIETPGGRGEAAEDIVRFLHDAFPHVSFVVSGEAKSAGTIMALSGNEILMTETGSLGPIDAQLQIGRSVVSAYDYMEWVIGKRNEAEDKGALNPFDAVMIAQISPGELYNVFNSLEFAKDLVKEWLVSYKFKNWTVTETRKIPVTLEMKEKRAKEIAEALVNHVDWRSHGRSIKIKDLKEKVQLKIEDVDANPELANVVYRIQTVCRIISETSSVFKMFATQDNKIFRQAIQGGSAIKTPQKPTIGVAEVEAKCPKCGTDYKLYAKLKPDPRIDLDFSGKGYIPFPKDAKIKCNCGFEMDLLGLKNQIEIQTGKKLLYN